MKKEDFDKALAVLTKQNPDDLAAIGLQVMTNDGEMQCVGVGSDGNLMVMAEIASQSAKFKMVGIGAAQAEAK